MGLFISLENRGMLGIQLGMKLQSNSKNREELNKIWNYNDFENTTNLIGASSNI